MEIDRLRRKSQDPKPKSQANSKISNPKHQFTISRFDLCFLNLLEIRILGFGISAAGGPMVPESIQQVLPSAGGILACCVSRRKDPEHRKRQYKP
jgi:hypothetical protein